MAHAVLETDCCIVGGGPAGMMLGYLLARNGVTVTVLEKHTDFFRDFRGDTVHPSTMEVLKEVDLLEKFLKMPHERVERLGVVIGGETVQVADFRHVPATSKFVALMPQWDFLNFLASEASKFGAFRLLMGCEAVGLVRDSIGVLGVLTRTNGQEMRVLSDLVVGCDGRNSVMRAAAGFKMDEYGVPIDVLWFQISRRPDDPAQVFGNINYGKVMILIDRSDYFQAGLLIRKGTFDAVKARGMAAFREDILQIVPWMGERVNELRDWEQVKILTVQINRLRQWYRSGLICIGDAAHAMSPAGGVGINLAIQDAVAAANFLSGPLLRGHIYETDLAAVQSRREFPTRITQAIQVAAHRGMMHAFERSGPIEVPWQLRIAERIPGIQRAVGYAVGMGARPEHVRGAGDANQEHLSVAKQIGRGIGIAATAVAFGWVAWKLWSKVVPSPNARRDERRPVEAVSKPPVLKSLHWNASR